MKLSEEALSSGTKLYCEAWIDEVETGFNKSEQHIFSQTFCKKMEKIISEQRKKERFWFSHKVAKKIAVAMAVILFSILGVTLSVEAYREKLINTVKTILRDLTEFRRTSVYDESSSTELNVSPEYIPDGFEKIYEFKTTNSNIYQYEKGDIIFSLCAEMYSSESAGVEILDTEDAEIRVEAIDGTEYMICLKADLCTIVWDKGNVSYTISGNMPEKDLISIAANVCNY